MKKEKLKTMTERFVQSVQREDDSILQKMFASELLDAVGIRNLDTYLTLTSHSTVGYAALMDRLQQPQPGDPDVLESLDALLARTDHVPADHLYSFHDPIEHLLWRSRVDGQAGQDPVPVSALYWLKGRLLAMRGCWKEVEDAMECARRWDPANAALCVGYARLCSDPLKKEKLLKDALYNALAPEDFADAYYDLSCLYEGDTKASMACAVAAALYDTNPKTACRLADFDPELLPDLDLLQACLAARDLPFYVTRDKTDALEDILDLYPEVEGPLCDIVDGVEHMISPAVRRQLAKHFDMP